MKHIPGNVTAAEYDRRVGELLTANNTEVERRRKAERLNTELLHALELLYDTGADSTVFNYARSKASAAITKAKEA